VRRKPSRNLLDESDDEGVKRAALSESPDRKTFDDLYEIAATNSHGATDTSDAFDNARAQSAASTGSFSVMNF